jgi:ABC-type siderophore export system fused ATPase/permease subunit
VRTHPVDKLFKQHCYKSAAGLLQLVRFRPISTQENFPRTENFPKISLLKVENVLFSARRQLFHKPVNLIKCILGD